MRIINAEKTDAPLIADVVITAVGEEITKDFAGDKGVEAVKTMFTRLAARDDSQYSYRNAMKSIDDNGIPMGFIIGYDGALLHELRLAFFEEAKEVLGKDMEGKMPDETVPDEFYLDSLAVFPEYRGRGIAGELIKAMSRRAADSGKPLGLLCDKSNGRARRLYESLGFRIIGETPFSSEMMYHMQKK